MKIGFSILMMVLGLVQFAAIVNGFTYTFGSFFGFIIAFILGEMPILGTIMGIIGAVNNWGWSLFQAILLFFGVPAAFFGISIIFSSISISAKRTNRYTSIEEKPNKYFLKGSIFKDAENEYNSQNTSISSSTGVHKKKDFNWSITFIIVLVIIIFSIVVYKINTDSTSNPPTSPQTSTYVKISTDLNVRAGPSTQYNIIALYRSGSIARVIGVYGNWYKVSFEMNSKPYTGWINREFTSRY